MSSGRSRVSLACYRAAGKALILLGSPVLAGAVKDLRAELGLPPLGTWQAVFGQQDAALWPVFHGFSPAVVPRPADWRDGLGVTGYWWPARAPDWHPPADLENFLSQGPPPVFIGFGSMVSADPDRLSDLVATAGQRAGVRTVIQAGRAGPGPVPGPVRRAGRGRRSRPAARRPAPGTSQVSRAASSPWSPSRCRLYTVGAQSSGPRRAAAPAAGSALRQRTPQLREPPRRHAGPIPQPCHHAHRCRRIDNICRSENASSEPAIDGKMRSQLIRPRRRMPANIAQLPISYGEGAQMHRLQFPNVLGACRAGQLHS